MKSRVQPQMCLTLLSATLTNWGQQEEPAIVISRLLLLMRHMYVDSICLDFHFEWIECTEHNLITRLDLLSLIISPEIRRIFFFFFCFFAFLAREGEKTDYRDKGRGHDRRLLIIWSRVFWPMICHVKLTGSVAREQKRFELWSLSPHSVTFGYY